MLSQGDLFFETAQNFLLEKESVRMRKFSLLLSILVLAALILVACGGEETSTSIPTQNVPPVTVDVTGTSEAGSGTATEMPTEGTATETPAIPVTGNVNSARLSNELDFTVWNQDGEQIGEVDDMVLDLDNTQVAYVVVNTSGFGDLGDRNILVPWDSLQLQTGAGDTTGGQQNAFILQTDQDTFSNAPDFDLSNLPQMGQSANDWDLDIRNYWQNGGVSVGTSNTPSASGTAMPDTTATAGAGTGTGLATATAGTGLATATPGTGTSLATTTPSTGTGTGQGTTTLQGVALASDVLGSTVTIGAQGRGNGTGTGLATATAGTETGTGLATATAGTGTGLATATAGTGTGLATSTPTSGTGGTGLATATAGAGTGISEGLTATIEDMLLDTTTGDILYIVLNTNSGNDQLIPVPLSMFQWDSTTQGFMLNTDTTMLQNAPSFSSDQFPDTGISDWNSEFDTFWQNNGAGGSSGTGTGTGSGSGAQATATP
jgi:sporulation protein YlmC with PRC-barrel domain